MNNTNVLEYRLIINKLSCPKCFTDYLHNYQYSFLWQSSSFSVSTNEYSFNNKTATINFNKTKLKLKLNQYSNDDKFTSTKLILQEKQINRDNDNIINLDEITLETNYFVINKRQATNITFNKIVADDIRIELRLNVTLIAKQISSSY